MLSVWIHFGFVLQIHSPLLLVEIPASEIVRARIFPVVWQEQSPLILGVFRCRSR